MTTDKMPAQELEALRYIQYECRDAIGYITLNRPEKRNALGHVAQAVFQGHRGASESGKNQPGKLSWISTCEFFTSGFTLA